MKAIMIEWVGPLCPITGMSMSMSGITVRTRAVGTFMFVFRSFAEALPRMYPNARCPTAKRVSFPLGSQTSAWLVIKFIGSESPLGARQSPLEFSWQNGWRHNFNYFISIESSSVCFWARIFGVLAGCRRRLVEQYLLISYVTLIWKQVC